MTKGSNKPLVPPLKDQELALHKKTYKNMKKYQPLKSLPFNDLKSVFGKKKVKNVGELSTSSKDKSKIEDLHQIPRSHESEYKSEPEFELEKKRTQRRARK